MSTISPRENLDRQIQQLLDQVLVLGSMVEQATHNAVNALKNHQPSEARLIYDNDSQINQKRFEIENTCLTLIATQQPMARDLRVIASVLEIATELERMGDYAKGNARICMMMKWIPPGNVMADLPKMADIATGMLHRAMGAFVAADAELAAKIPKEDTKVDDLYNKINRSLVAEVTADPTMIDQTNLLIWAAHNLERMADRVTNICERTIYVATGEMKELDVTDDEQDFLLD